MCDIQCKSCNCNRGEQKLTITEMMVAVETAKQYCTVLHWPSRSVSWTMRVATRAMQPCYDSAHRHTWLDPSRLWRSVQTSEAKTIQIMSVVFLGTRTITGSSPGNNQGLNINHDCVLDKPPIKYFLFKSSRWVFLNESEHSLVVHRSV